MNKIQKYDLSTLIPIMESKQYAIYTLGQINENLWKAVRLNKKTQEQDEVKIEKLPRFRVIEVVEYQKQR